ncbi:hypothetical protein KIPB_005173 [Kipferlia bialata]|uniref:Uncharacterized protein n=1 Tax=Kipferlia bialata TaxID=797122 RepID=A0A391NLM9_9EUKA|nr:hypothetical protein KIPB_005173 [Kipferlia bialata]|eukprot:g5173.t1
MATTVTVTDALITEWFNIYAEKPSYPNQDHIPMIAADQVAFFEAKFAEGNDLERYMGALHYLSHKIRNDPVICNLTLPIIEVWLFIVTLL